MGQNESERWDTKVKYINKLQLSKKKGKEMFH